MGSIYKSISPDDISRIPFNANKKFKFTTSGSAQEAGVTIQQFFSPYHLDKSLDDSAINISGSFGYYQLDHLFYKNYLLNINNRLGDADYLNQKRNLYWRANVISIPSSLYGNQIQPGSFAYTETGKQTFIDDSKGNLILSGTNLISHSIDEKEKIFNLGPIKGFKRYDVNFDIYGVVTPEIDTYYNKEKVYDDSYHFNLVEYKNILFSETHWNANAALARYCTGSKIDFNSSTSLTSSIVSPHKETYNFNSEDDFTIAFWVNPISASAYLVSKSTTKTIIKTPISPQTYTTGSSQPFDVRDKNNYPFEIYIDPSQNLTFRRSDLVNTPIISSSISTGSISHIACMRSASRMEIWINGSRVASGSDTTVNTTENQSNLYIGSKGEISNYFTGSMSNLLIFNSSRTEEQIKSLRSTFDGNPYVGNIFYSHGLATFTHPKYHKQTHLPIKPVNQGGNLSELEFRNVHPIYENEYMCTVNADEYNYTHNVSTRKSKTDKHHLIANFATSSIFKPYVTTVGLYNENNELLVVGKMGQPVRLSDETDTTFVLRWDT